MKYLVTGATGFVGSNLAHRLVKDGHAVLVTGTVGEQDLPVGCIYLGRDYNDLEEFWLEGVDAVFHQAADNDPQSKDLIGIHKTNVYDAALMFETLYHAGCRRFIYASSTAVYGDSKAPYNEETTPVKPLTPYAYSKAALEQLAHAFHRLHTDARFCGLRYCNVYGPGEGHKEHRASVIHQMIRTMKERNQPRLFKYGDQRRDWVHVDDVVQANILALESTGYSDEVFNVGSGASVSFCRLVEIINSHMGTTINAEFIDNPHENTYQSHTECDITSARAILGYNPVYTVENGILHYLENWK